MRTRADLAGIPRVTPLQVVIAGLAVTAYIQSVLMLERVVVEIRDTYKRPELGHGPDRDLEAPKRCPETLTMDNTEITCEALEGHHGPHGYRDPTGPGLHDGLVLWHGDQIIDTR